MRKSAPPEQHDEKPLKDNPPSTAPIRQPIPKARLANIREAMSQSSLAEARSKSYRNALPPSVSSAETASESNSSDSPNYLITILQQLSALPPRSAPLQVKDASDSEKQWLEDNFRSYADHFHHRWHVITAATYEFSEKPFDNAASVIMIGSYFSSRENRNSVCLSLHRKLVDRYKKLLVSAFLFLYPPRVVNGLTSSKVNILESKIIPDTMRRLETYQSILINIIFALLLDVCTSSTI